MSNNILKKILVISNGKGEDSIAITILNNLKRVLAEEGYTNEQIKISVLPLVDNGSGYKKNGFDTIATWNTMPSKGFNILNVFNLLKDLQVGLWNNLRKQIFLLKKESQDTQLIVTVGDIFPVLLAGFWGNKVSVIHIGTAISAYIREYNLLEIWFLKKYVASTICRDELTAQKLRENQVPAIFYGNPMMDDPLLNSSNKKLPLENNKKTIALIPSSREDAYNNTWRMLKVIRFMPKKNAPQLILSLAPNLNVKMLAQVVSQKGWRYEDLSKNNTPLIAKISHPEAPGILVIKGCFRECLDQAQLAIGMTGTGNEQIVGLGIPLVLLRGKSAAASKGRMIHYKKLLGDAIYLTNGADSKIAENILLLLKNTKLLHLMGEVGKQRMGLPGGSYSIARKIFSHLVNPNLKHDYQ